MSDRSGPVKRWADMTPTERARVAGATKPPPRQRAILPYFECTRGVDDRPEDHTDDPEASETERRRRGVAAYLRLRNVEVEVSKLVRETEAAELWEMDGGEKVWWPKSQIVDREIEENGSGTLWVTKFIAREKGIG